MAKVADIVAWMRENPKGVRYSELQKVCEHYFGPPRQQGTSHSVYETRWAGDPRVNIQRGESGMAKVYQVEQVVQAIDKLEEMQNG
jgi:hypothetical protein